MRRVVKWTQGLLVFFAILLAVPLGGAWGGLQPEGPAPDRVEAAAWQAGHTPALATPHKPNRLVFHWTAGSWTAVFRYYHFNVLGNGKPVATFPVLQRAAHVYQRNTGAIGISACAGAGARIVNGYLVNTKYPLQPIQIETMAKLGAELCHDFKINPSGTVQVDGFTAPTLTGHHWWAAHDGYGPDRSEMGAYQAGLFGKVKWYFAKLATGAQQFQHSRKGGIK